MPMDLSRDHRFLSGTAKITMANIRRNYKAGSEQQVMRFADAMSGIRGVSTYFATGTEGSVR